MSGDVGSRLPMATRQRSGATLLVIAILVVGTIAVGLVVAGTAVAQADEGTETTPPELHSGEKVNATAVELLFIDDAGLNASSIGTEDFLLSDGELSHVAVTTEETNATATLVLAEPIQVDELTVGIATDSDIQDVSGTHIRADENPSVTISGMDGAPPGILGTNVSDAVGGPADIEFRFDEPVSALHVEITGPENVTLTVDDFENPRANRYAATYEPPESGEYRVALLNATDEAGNTGNYSVVRTFEADRSDPTAVIGIDFGASGATNVTFDASQSVGDRLNYTWDFSDGMTATGERVSHEFTPEEHTVALTVEDEFGNTDTDRIDLNLTDGLESEEVAPESGAGDPAVIVDRDDPTAPRQSLVSVTGAHADQSLEVGAAGDSEEPLLERGAVALDNIAITPAVNTSFSFALSALAPGDVGDVTDEETVPLGGFSILSDATGGELSSAEFTFSVESDRLDNHDLSPERVALQRHVDGEWVCLETTVLEASGDRYHFSAATSGFSRFAVVGTTSEGVGDDGGDGDAEPSMAVTDATVDATEIESGEAVTVTATVENDGERAGSFQAGLELDGTAVDTRDVEVDAGDSGTVQFTPTLDDEGTVEIAVNGTVAGDVTVTEREDDEDGDEHDLDVDEEAFSVVNVRLNETSIEPGEVVEIEGDVLNEGDEMKDFVAELEVDGEVVDTFEVPQVPPGEDVPVWFTQQFDDEGTYTISISGTSADSELTVGEGGLFEFLGFLPLGFVPFGLLRTVVTFVGIPLLFVYLVLKSLAFYLGY